MRSPRIFSVEGAPNGGHPLTTGMLAAVLPGTAARDVCDWQPMPREDS
jgi:hypothetical protein